jgi:hypothetical protein
MGRQGKKSELMTVVLGLLGALALLLAAGPAVADCPDTKVQCWGKHPDTGENTIKCGEIVVGACWKWKDLWCWPCASTKGGGMCDYRDDCARAFPNCCQGQSCFTYWKGGASEASCGQGGW